MLTCSVLVWSKCCTMDRLESVPSEIPWTKISDFLHPPLSTLSNPADARPGDLFTIFDTLKRHQENGDTRQIFFLHGRNNTHLPLASPSAAGLELNPELNPPCEDAPAAGNAVPPASSPPSNNIPSLHQPHPEDNESILDNIDLASSNGLPPAVPGAPRNVETDFATSDSTLTFPAPSTMDAALPLAIPDPSGHVAISCSASTDAVLTHSPDDVRSISPASPTDITAKSSVSDLAVADQQLITTSAGKPRRSRKRAGDSDTAAPRKRAKR